MCQFFSFVGDGFGNYLYSDWSIREKYLSESPDSHTRILTNNNIPSDKQDRWSKYEFNPWTKQFTVDEPVEGHDHEAAENWVNALNFKEVCPYLIIKPIINPLSKTHKGKITEKELELLRQWNKTSIWDSIRDSIWGSIGDSIWDSIWGSIRDSIGDSIWDSIWGSVRDGIWGSVRDGIWAYCSSFVDIPYDYDFSSVIELYKRNLVPSFDGTTWRLYTGKQAKIVWEGKL